MVDQRYSLRWDQYQSHLVTAFENLRDDHDFVDVTLGVGGKKLMAHKMLLSACSPYFRELLKDNPCQHPIILLRDIPYLDLEALLQFMYQGQVSVQQDRLESLLKSAQHLSISGLAENKEDEAKEVIPLPSSVPENSKAPKSLSEVDKKRKHNKRRSSNDNETSSECNIKQLNKQARLTHTGDRRERFEVKHEVIDVADEGEEERYKGSNHGSSDPKKGEERTSSDATDYQITPASETADQIGGEYDGDDVGVESYPAIEDCASQEYYVNEGWTWAEQEYQQTESLLPTTQPVFSCQICNKQFASKPSLTNHIPSHFGKTTCTLCGKKESTRSNLYRHMTQRCKGLPENPS